MTQKIIILALVLAIASGIVYAGSRFYRQTDIPLQENIKSPFENNNHPDTEVPNQSEETRVNDSNAVRDGSQVPQPVDDKPVDDTTTDNPVGAEIKKPDEPQVINNPPANTDEVTIDFGTCAPDRKTIFASFGSTVYEIKGRAGDNCQMYYGSESENPNWDGKLSTFCEVPASLGKLNFRKNSTGADFSTISQYCKQN